MSILAASSDQSFKRYQRISPILWHRMYSENGFPGNITLFTVYTAVPARYQCCDATSYAPHNRYYLYPFMTLQPSSRRMRAYCYYHSAPAAAVRPLRCCAAAAARPLCCAALLCLARPTAPANAGVVYPKVHLTTIHRVMLYNNSKEKDN